MSLNNTPSSERVHIGIFGKRNAGKSSVINAITGQNIAIVSEIKGTTTDPVYKSMELLPLGPVMIIDTPGLDDTGELGRLRIQKSNQVLNKTDIAVLIIDAECGKTEQEREFIKRLIKKNIPYIVVYNKSDICKSLPVLIENEIYISAKTGENIHELKELISRQTLFQEGKYKLVADIVDPSDFVVLVVPIDSAAPKGRLILPQQQTIREILEAGAVSVVVKETELKNALNNLGKKPKLVITDSQAFAQVSKDTPKDIMLTSFSILFSRYKGELETQVKGAKSIENIKDGEKILISEGCTHHRQCEDIGTVKLPRWIKQYTGKNIEFEYTSGTEFPDDLRKYKMIIHCGGCMLNDREMKYRIKCAQDQNIPITNFGVQIAYINGILKRTLEPFADIASIL